MEKWNPIYSPVDSRRYRNLVSYLHDSKRNDDARQMMSRQWWWCVQRQTQKRFTESSKESRDGMHFLQETTKRKNSSSLEKGQLQCTVKAVLFTFYFLVTWESNNCLHVKHETLQDIILSFCRSSLWSLFREPFVAIIVSVEERDFDDKERAFGIILLFFQCFPFSFLPLLSLTYSSIITSSMCLLGSTIPKERWSREEEDFQSICTTQDKNFRWWF